MKKNDKKNLNNSMIIFLIIVFDLLCFLASWRFLTNFNIFTKGYYGTYIPLLLIYLISYLFFNNIYDAYAIGRRKISENAYSLTLSCTFSIIIFYFLDTLAFRHFRTPWYVLVTVLLQMIVNIKICTKAHNEYFKKYSIKNSIVIYGNDYDIQKIKNIPFFDMKYKIEKTIQGPKTYKSVSDELEKYDVVFISGIKATLRNGIVKECVNKGIESYVIPHIGDVIMAGGRYVEEMSIPMVRVERGTPDTFYIVIKRAFDIIVSSCAAIILFPFMVIIALAIKLYDGGPILYKQTRLTKDRKTFTILKFRSMKVDAEKDGVARLVSKQDDRITPIGKIIRSIRFDELPQIYNILKGDMSIVGPRPERPEIAEQYEKIYPSFALRLQVKAGLTGYAQIYGKYNTEPLDKLKMDLFYINKMSFLYDIQLCFMTIKTLFMKESTDAIEEGKIVAVKSRDNE